MTKFIFTIILTLNFCSIVFSQTKEDSCPKLKSVEYSPNIIVFSVETNNSVEKSKLSYKWSVHDGKIIHGENTNSIVFLSESNSIFVSVKIEGLPENCVENILEYSIIRCPPDSRKTDEYNKISKPEEIERLTYLFTELKNDSLAKAVIKLREDKDLLEHIRFLIANFKKQNVDKTQILFAVAKEGVEQTEIWIIPNGAEMRDCQNCLIFASKDFEKFEKLFQPKPIIKKRKK